MSEKLKCPSCFNMTITFHFLHCFVPPNRISYQCDNEECGFRLYAPEWKWPTQALVVDFIRSAQDESFTPVQQRRIKTTEVGEG